MMFTVIRQFNSVTDAYLYRMLLEEGKIPCHLNDEYVSTIQPLYSQAIGGIKLIVPTEYVEQANTLLEVFEAKPITNEEGDTIVCPKCSSEKIESGYRSNKSLGNFFSFLLGFIFTVLPIYSKYVYRCKSCRKEFDVTKKSRYSKE